MREKDYFYKEINTREIVFKDEAQEYVCEKLGLTIKPVGIAGSYTLDQLDFLQEFEDWYFSGNWVKYYEDEERYKEVVNEELNVYDGF